MSNIELKILLFIGVPLAIIFLTFTIDIYFTTESILKESGYLVEEIDLESIEFFSVDTAKIINLDRNEYIFPKDRLRYGIILLRTLPSDLIFIEPYIQVFVGLNNVTNYEKLGLVQLSPASGYGVISYSYSPTESGIHEIKLNLKILNEAEEKLMSVKTSNTFEVLTSSDKLQAELNRHTIIGIIVTASISVSAVLFVAYQTLQLRNEKKHTIRAWLGQINSKDVALKRIVNEDNEFLSLNQWNSMTQLQKQAFGNSSFMCAMSIKNFGQLPTLDARPRSITSRNPNLTELNNEKFWEAAEIMPQDSADYLVAIPTDWLEETRRVRNFKFYLMFEIKYTSSNSNEEHVYGFISEYTMEGLSKLGSWDETNKDKIQKNLNLESNDPE